MIKTTKLPKTILARIPNVAAYLQSRPDVCFSYLFGSLSQGRVAPLSDVDIAVYMSDEHDLTLKKLEILGKLNEILKTDEIDLVVLNSASLPIKFNILKKGKLLVDKEPHTRHQYQSLTMRKYFDFHRFESGILKRRYFSGR
jgi:uncharacterized protein